MVLHLERLNLARSRKKNVVLAFEFMTVWSDVYNVLCESLSGVAYSTSLSWDEGRTKPHVQINCWVTSNGKGKAARGSNFLDSLASASV